MGFILYDGARWHRRPKSGYYANSRRSPSLLHRYVWAQEVGPIPPGHVIHHRFPDDKHTTDVSRLECLSSNGEHISEKHPHSIDWHRAGGRATWDNRESTQIQCIDCGADVITRSYKRYVHCSTCNQKR